MDFFRLLATNIRLQYEESLRNSPIASSQFLPKTERSVIRSVWTLTFLTSFTIAWIIIVDMYSKFLHSATITVMEVKQQGQPLEFPAVFLCPKQAMNESLLEEFVKETKTIYNVSMSQEELKTCLKFLLNLMHERHFEVPQWQEFVELQQNFGFERKIMTLLINASDYLRDCYFKGTAITCNQYFYPDFTEIGYCFVFNNVNVKDMNFVNMNNFFSIETLTNNNRRVAMIYEHDIDWDLRFEMLEHNTPILIYLKSTSGTLTLKDRPAFVWNQGRVMGFQFNILESICSDDIRTLLLSQRKCLFSDEISPYGPYNSLVERGSYNPDFCTNICHATKVFKQCKCLPKRYKLLFPKLNYTSCTIVDFFCYATQLNMAKTMECDLCPKQCSSLKYIGGREIRIVAKEEPEAIKIVPIEKREELFYGTTRNNETCFPITIGLEKWPRLRHRTNIIFGWIELLISLGGIGGLLFGFSFVNQIELIYFFTLRLLCTYHINKETLQLKKVASENKIPFINLALVPQAKRSNILTPISH